MMKKWAPVAVIAAFLLIVILAAIVIIYQTKHPTQLPTYFNYTEREYHSLNHLSSSEIMAKGKLKKWDFMMFELVKSNKLGDAYAARVYSYVYVAQRDAAFLSYNTKQKFMGSLDPVTGQILCLFFANNCEKIRFQIKSDPYSEKLAAIVLEKVAARLKSEVETSYPPKVGNDFWAGVKPYYAEGVGGWQTWIIDNPQHFLPPKPPAASDMEWERQLKLTENALKNISPQQVKLVVFWAGNPSTVTPPGIWLKFANDYLESIEISFPKMLLIRSVLAMGISDATISVFHAKYTYWVKRPNMLNPSLQTIMPTANHPSYPAAHSTISSAAAEILTYFFPENRTNWQQKAEEAGLSRVWGGIHFPIDIQMGMEQGKKIGGFVTQSQPKLD